MTYEFNSNNIFVGFIKELLMTFNLPKCHVFVENIPCIKDSLYLYKTKLYRYIGENNLNVQHIDSTNFEVVQDYFYGEKILNVTKNLIPKNNYYDTYTHEYLGNYLRFLRDYKNINLLPLYNCFSNSMPTNLSISVNNIQFSSYDKGYDIYMIPIKYTQSYTIAIDCQLPIELCVGLYDNKLINVDDNKLIKKYYKKVACVSYTNPIIIENILPDNDSNFKTLYNLENYLKLFIKVPHALQSSISILEGKYLNNVNFYINDNGEKAILKSIIAKDKTIAIPSCSNVYVTKLSLLNINTTKSIPFSERLIEYLFDNAITSIDKIDKNIKKVQLALINAKKFGYYTQKYGAWDTTINKAIYELEKAYNLIDTKFDLLTYVDKDVEKFLGDI